MGERVKLAAGLKCTTGIVSNICLGLELGLRSGLRSGLGLGLELGVLACLCFESAMRCASRSQRAPSRKKPSMYTPSTWLGLGLGLELGLGIGIGLGLGLGIGIGKGIGIGFDVDAVHRRLLDLCRRLLGSHLDQARVRVVGVGLR